MSLHSPELEEYFANWVPDADTVRGVYVDAYGNAAGAEFDRWLAEVKAEAWEEGQLALLGYMGVPLYPSKGDEPRNPKQPRNPYRQGGEQ